MTENEFSPPNDLKTSVLFLVFNRLDTTIQVFEQIRKAKPPRLYLASDGAREAVKGEFEKVKEIRDYIMSNIDWNCEVKTLFREKNLGCKYAVSSAIDWFFENEEMGIILEDDCLPSQSFFWYCEELLFKYKDDLRIWHINGVSLIESKKKIHSYYFSNYPGIWGWATWANRWINYDLKLDTYEGKSELKKLDFKLSTSYWNKIFKTVKENKIDTWDYQWVYSIWSNKGRAITPYVNQIKNIGFNENGTHTIDSNTELANLKNSNLNFINHPSIVKVNQSNDLWLSDKYYPSLAFRIFNKFKSYFKIKTN